MSPRARVPAPVALKMAYDGRRFDGFARQPDKRLRTVEGELLSALRETGAIRDDASAGLRPGSRTDRRVSARESVVCFRSLVPPERLPGALFDRVPGLWPLSARAVAPGFDPRRAAWREYRYFVVPGELPEGVGRGRLAAALELFVGRHDFSAFARREAHRAPVREVLEVGVDEALGGRLFVVRVRGASFLWQQVRRMMAAALAVCRAEADAHEVQGMLRAGSGPAPWGVAPPERLVLWRVFDPRLDFPLSSRVREDLGRAWMGEWGDAQAALGLLDGLLGSLEPTGGRK